MDRRFVAILAGLLIVFAAIFTFSKHSNNTNTGAGGTQPTNHIQGLNQKQVTLVEYGDYQCPVCGIYYQPLKQVVAQFNNDIHFQFRNLPITAIHTNAYAAARAAEAAGLQGKYWEMHDMLYENQEAWSSSPNIKDTFDSYARTLGLNTQQFAQDYSSNKVNDAINADLAAFNKTGQQVATPTFFLDGRYLPNSDVSDSKTGQPSAEKFANILNAEIAKVNKK